MAERITITIETGNAAFDDAPATEIARILRALAGSFAGEGFPPNGRRLLDVNGNTVGAVTIEKLEARP